MTRALAIRVRLAILATWLATWLASVATVFSRVARAAPPPVVVARAIGVRGSGPTLEFVPMSTAQARERLVADGRRRGGLALAYGGWKQREDDPGAPPPPERMEIRYIFGGAKYRAVLEPGETYALRGPPVPVPPTLAIASATLFTRAMCAIDVTDRVRKYLGPYLDWHDADLRVRDLFEVCASLRDVGATLMIDRRDGSVWAAGWDDHLDTYVGEEESDED